MKPRIGVLTSGGDCPGLNAVLRGVVLAADKLGWDVVGFRDGFEGLLPPGHHMILDRKSTDGIMALGGTILGTTNRGHFVAKTGAGDRTVVPAQVISDAKKILADLQVNALIIVGGDGSLVTAQQLQEAGINCIGVPKTIDNDLEATATTFGFDSAVDVVVDALDRLHTTATSHRRVMVVEVMGRYAGWIALHGGIAGGADVILIPEIPYNLEKVAHDLRTREERGAKFSIVVVAEGARPIDGKVSVVAEAHGGYAERLGGAGMSCAKQLEGLTGKETRYVVLGHLQRGGVPTAFDRTLATRFGGKAVELLVNGQFGKMVANNPPDLVPIPLGDVVGRTKTVPLDYDLLLTARALGVSFGD